MIFRVSDRFRFVAFLSDIHGNLPALQAVSASLPSACFIVGLGDYVGYYTEPEEICGWMAEHAHGCIRGNHDAYTTRQLVYNADKERDYRIEWTRHTLSQASLNWLSSLTTDATVILPNSTFSFRLRHASPFDEETYIYPDTVMEFVQAARSECLMLGHTHHPMARRHGLTWVINPGSVGQPRNHLPGAHYCLYDTLTRKLSFHAIQYDYEAYKLRLARLGVSERFVNMINRRRFGVSLPRPVLVYDVVD